MKVNINNLNNEGQGVCRVNGKVTFVPYALLDEASSSNQTAAAMNFEKQTPVELFIEFYEKMKGEKPVQEEIDIIEKLLKEDDENDAT